MGLPLVLHQSTHPLLFLLGAPVFENATTSITTPMVANHWSANGLGMETRPTNIRIAPMINRVFVVVVTTISL